MALIIPVGMSVVISTVAQAGNIYIAQTAQGTGAGSSCTNAKAVTWFNTAANWGSGSSRLVNYSKREGMKV